MTVRILSEIELSSNRWQGYALDVLKYQGSVQFSSVQLAMYGARRCPCYLVFVRPRIFVLIPDHHPLLQLHRRSPQNLESYVYVICESYSAYISLMPTFLHTSRSQSVNRSHLYENVP